MNSKYNPVYPYYDDIFAKEQKKSSSKVIYFGNGTDLEEVKGKIIEIVKEPQGEFLVFETGEKVRIDRIITINGIPGPAYDEYDRFALACLDCSINN